MCNNRINLADWSYEGDQRVKLVYTDKDVLYVTREDFNRAFGAIVSASKDEVIRDFAIKDGEE